MELSEAGIIESQEAKPVEKNDLKKFSSNQPVPPVKRGNERSAQAKKKRTSENTDRYGRAAQPRWTHVIARLAVLLVDFTSPPTSPSAGWPSSQDVHPSTAVRFGVGFHSGVFFSKKRLSLHTLESDWGEGK